MVTAHCSRPLKSLPYFLTPAPAPAGYHSPAMRYALAIFFPSIAMLLCGQVLQALLCFILHITVIGWPLATLWAWLVIHDHNEDLRIRRMTAWR